MKKTIAVVFLSLFTVLFGFIAVATRVTAPIVRTYVVEAETKEEEEQQEAALDATFSDDSDSLSDSAGGDVCEADTNEEEGLVEDLTTQEPVVDNGEPTNPGDTDNLDQVNEETKTYKTPFNEFLYEFVKGATWSPVVKEAIEISSIVLFALFAFILGCVTSRKSAKVPARTEKKKTHKKKNSKDRRPQRVNGPRAYSVEEQDISERPAHYDEDRGHRGPHIRW